MSPPGRVVNRLDEPPQPQRENHVDSVLLHGRITGHAFNNCGHNEDIRMRSCVGILTLLVIAQVALGDAKSDFDELFGKEVRRVSASHSSAKAVALAKQMVEIAGTLEGNEELKVLLWTRATAFTERFSAGYETAVKSLNNLIKATGDKSGLWSGKLISVHGRRYVIARGKDKLAAGREYIQQIMAIAETQTKSGQATAAMASYRKALAVATSLRSPKKTEILSRMKSAAAATKMQMKIDSALAALEKKPDDIKLRESIVRMYLVEFDKPDQAAKLLNEDSDQQLRTYIPLAAGKVEAIDTLVCFEMGQWYWSMFAGAKTTSAKTTILNRTKTYLEHFASLHTAKDMSSLQAKTILEKVDKELAKLGPSVSKPAFPVKGAVMLLAFDKTAMSSKSGILYCSDASGKGNHGRFMMGAKWTPKGLAGGGCLLDGNDDYINCGAGKSLTLSGAMTISIWINLTDWETGGGLCTKGAGQGGESYLLDMSGGGVRFVRRPANKGAYCSVTSAKSIKKGQWTHVVAVADGKELRLYVNLAESIGKNFSGPALSNTHIVAMGSRQSNQSAYDANTAGIIDQAAIFPRARNTAEIQKLYDQHKKEAGLDQKQKQKQKPPRRRD